MNDSTALTVYEQASNPRIRMFMRIDFLNRQCDYHSASEEVWARRAMLDALLELIQLLNRHNIKRDLIRELDQRLTWLHVLSGAEGANPQRVRDAILLHQQLRDEVFNLEYPTHQYPGDNELLNSINQRMPMSGCRSETDIPLLQHWLDNPQINHAELLNLWRAPLEPITRITGMILDMIRKSASFEPVTAQNGWYEQTLDANRTHQMLRIRLPAASPFYPETSISRGTFSIVFRDSRELPQRPCQARENVDFELACCLF